MKRFLLSLLVLAGLGFSTPAAASPSTEALKVIASAGVPMLSDFALVVLTYVNTGQGATMVGGQVAVTGAQRTMKVENDGTVDVNATFISPPSVTANQGTPNAGGALSWFVQGSGVAGTPAGGVLTVQGVSGGTPSVTTETYTTLFNGDIQVTNAGGGTLVCPSAPGRRDCMIVNNGPQNLWCKHGVPTVGTGVELLPSVGFWDAFTSATITCIADVAGQASAQTHTSEISP